MPAGDPKRNQDWQFYCSRLQSAFLFCFVFFDTGFLCVALAVLSWNSLSRAGWPELIDIHLPLPQACVTAWPVCPLRLLLNVVFHQMLTIIYGLYVCITGAWVPLEGSVESPGLE